MSNLSVSELEAQVAVDPLNSTLMFALIDQLRGQTPRCEDKLKSYREIYSSTHLAPKAFWQLWLSDSMESGNADICTSLFKEALTSVPDFEIAIACLDYSSALVDLEKMTVEAFRSLFEHIIVMCGSDVFTGSEIWKRYREFEVDEHEELLDMQAAATDIQKSKERFIKVYLRQLSLPLVGNEETLKEFEEKLGEFCVESDAALIQPAELEKKIAAAREQRESRLIYEMHLLSDKYSSSGVAEKELFWQGYVAFEKKQSQLSRMQRLYERAVMECPQSTQLWLEFTDFALATLKNWQLLSSVTRRAVKVHRNSLFLWKLRLLSMECTNEAPDNIQLEFQRAVSFGLAGVDEYLELYLAYCDYQRRALYVCYNKHQSGGNSNRQEPTSAGEVAEKLTAQVQQMQAALQQVQVFLTSYGAQWPAGWWKLCKYQAQVETSLLCPVQDFVSTLLTTAAAAGTSEDAPAVQFTGKSAVSSKKAKTVKLLPGSEIWETATKLFPGTFFLWSEYILWAKNTGEYEHCRKLYRKLTNLHLDVSAEEVCQQWVQFEQQYGSVADLQVALIRAYPHAQSTILASAAKTVGNTETEAEAAAGQVAAVSSPAASTSEAMQVVDQDQGQAGSSTSNGRGAGDMKRKRSSSPSREEGRTTSSSDSALAQGSAKKVKFVAAADPPAAVVANFGANSASTAPSPHPPSVVPLSDTTVVVSNFPFAASLETVRPLLEDKCRLSGADLSAAGISPEQCKVVDMRLVLSKAGHSRGMVEIEFAPIVCTSTSAGSTSTNTKEGAALQHSVLQLAVQALNGATYNDRALRAEIKPLPVPVPIDGLTGPTGKGRGVKVDPLVAQQRAGSVAAPHLTTVFVSHLSKSVGNAELTAHFASCGDILAAKVAVDKKTKESKCTGLVQFKDEAGRSAALKLNKTQMGSETIGVTPSRFSLIPVANAPAETTASAAPTSSSSSSSHSAPSSSSSKSDHSVPTNVTEDTSSTLGTSTGVGVKSTSDGGKVKQTTAAALAKVSTMSFKPRNLVKQTPKGKIQL